MPHKEQRTAFANMALCLASKMKVNRLGVFLVKVESY
jgi:hypothetical protein